MFQEYRKELDWGGRKLILETGKVARQADGCGCRHLRRDQSALHGRGRAHAPGPDWTFSPSPSTTRRRPSPAGKIPGGFFKREGRPSEKETPGLPAHRPADPPAVRQGLQVRKRRSSCTVLSHDLENDPDVVALIGASAALTLVGVALPGSPRGLPGGLRELAISSSIPRWTNCPLRNSTWWSAGTQEGVLMVESEASELSEDIMLGAVMFGHRAYQEVIRRDHRTGRGLRQRNRAILPLRPKGMDALVARVRSAAEADLRGRLRRNRQARCAKKGSRWCASGSSRK